MSYNKVLLIGNVGRDPEVRHLESGASVATFTLATTERYKDRNGQYQDQTEWHNIVCWRNLADLSQNYISKGSQIFVEGKIRTRSWTDQTGQKRYTTEIVADNIRLLGKRGDNQQHAACLLYTSDAADDISWG
ncbi:MAG: single-stranded DNA-binding protein, partial [Bacteroidetes bacterium]|nr:single-stranded DNA-binding protein [Candidatus Egerieousia excrementavium]